MIFSCKLNFSFNGFKYSEYSSLQKRFQKIFPMKTKYRISNRSDTPILSDLPIKWQGRSEYISTRDQKLARAMEKAPWRSIQLHSSMEWTRFIRLTQFLKFTSKTILSILLILSEFVPKLAIFMVHRSVPRYYCWESGDFGKNSLFSSRIEWISKNRPIIAENRAILE